MSSPASPPSAPPATLPSAPPSGRTPAARPASARTRARPPAGDHLAGHAAFSVDDVEFVARLGKGLGAGRFKARLTGDEEPVSLLLFDAAALEKTEFVRWGRLLARVEHPGVPAMALIEHVLEPHFVAQRFVEGRTLAERLAEEPGGLPEVEAMGLVLQTAAALRAVHQQGLAHGHLSPADLVLVPRNGAPDAVQVVGWRPLVAAGGAVEAAAEGARADVDALGALLYETLTGSPKPSQLPAAGEGQGGGKGFDRMLMDWTGVRKGDGLRRIADLCEAGRFTDVDAFVDGLLPRFSERVAERQGVVSFELGTDREFRAEVERQRGRLRELESKLRFIRQWLRDHASDIDRIDEKLARLSSQSRSLNNLQVEVAMLLDRPLPRTDHSTEMRLGDEAGFIVEASTEGPLPPAMRAAITAEANRRATAPHLPPLPGRAAAARTGGFSAVPAGAAEVGAAGASAGGASGVGSGGIGSGGIGSVVPAASEAEARPVAGSDADPGFADDVPSRRNRGAGQRAVGGSGRLVALSVAVAAGVGGVWWWLQRAPESADAPGLIAAGPSVAPGSAGQGSASTPATGPASAGAALGASVAAAAPGSALASALGSTPASTAASTPASGAPALAPASAPASGPASVAAALASAPASAPPAPGPARPPVAPAGMAYVPPGSFQPGLDAAGLARVIEFCRAELAEFPEQAATRCTEETFAGEVALAAQAPVPVKGFFLDRTEISQDEWEDCRKANKCGALQLKWDLGNQPATGVKFAMAKAFCSYRGGRLPTHVEWQYAARGAERRLFPWGDTAPVVDGKHRDNYGMPTKKGTSSGRADGHKYAAPVGTFEAQSASPFGVANLGGNVREWTATEPSPGTAVVAGAGWTDLGIDLRVTRAEPLPHDKFSNELGFRCLVDLEAPAGAADDDAETEADGPAQNRPDNDR